MRVNSTVVGTGIAISEARTNPGSPISVAPSVTSQNPFVKSILAWMASIFIYPYKKLDSWENDDVE